MALIGDDAATCCKPATTKQTMTCSEVKAAYKAASCCGNPSKSFTITSSRRLLADSDSYYENLLDNIREALEESQMSGGSSESKQLAELINRAADSADKLLA